MLSFLVLGISINPSLTDPRLPVDSLEHASKALEDMGYRFVPSSDGSEYGKLVRQDRSVSVSFYAQAYGSGKGAARLVRSLHLRIQLAIPREVSLDPTAVDRKNSARWNGILVLPHLGRTVSIETPIDLTTKPTQSEVRASLDRFWRQATEYAHDHDAPFEEAHEPDWSKVAFPEGYVLMAADEISLIRATSSWG